MKRKSVRNKILFTAAMLVLAFSYYRNIWGVVDNKSFNESDVYCESQVLGRVIRSEKSGIFSEGGLNGWVKDDSLMKDMSWDQMTYFQFDIYTKNLKTGPPVFIIYDSQLGGQGIVYALIDKISPFSNSINLYVFWMINSFSLAFLITVFISWIFKNYGYKASLVTFLLILMSPWLTYFGRDLYLVLTFFYLPFIVLLMMLHYESGGKAKLSLTKIYLLSSGIIFLKLFFSGFEFITSALVMFTIPLFYYAILSKWKLKFLIARFAIIVSGVFTAIISYAIIFAYQLSTIKGSFWYGFEYMKYCFLKRTYGNSADFPEAFKDSLEANIMAVFKYYFHARAINFGLVGISFGFLILSLAVFSFISFLPERISPSTFSMRQRNLALVFTAWISLSGPLSWFVIFKAHSFIHLGFDEIVWYMPFCLFVFATAGSVGSTIAKDLRSYFEKG
jgi:hypothetical protein